MKESLSLTVTIKPNDGNVAVFITYPQEQQKLTLSEMAQILTGGISLIVKLANNDEENIKDYEIIERVVKQLNEDFISTQSFEDAKRLDRR
jgi:hypothetical protein